MFRRLAKSVTCTARVSSLVRPYGCVRTITTQECAQHLEKTAEKAEDVHAVLDAMSPATRRYVAAAVMRKYVKDDELDQVVCLLPGQDVRALGLASLSHHFGTDFRKEFQSIDQDDSRTISRQEFRRYIAEKLPEIQDADAPCPTRRQLVLFGLNSAIPFVVFGFLDNSIMILGGDVVDDLIGSTLQLSTLACAAVANTFADVLGISIGNSVEAVTQKLGLPPAMLTPKQAELPSVRRLGLASGSLGILVGCILGMAPLLVVDQEKKALKEAFMRVDVNGDGYLTAPELQAVLTAAGYPCKEETVVKAVKVMDLDRDGKVNMEEFLSTYTKLKSVLQKIG